MLRSLFQHPARVVAVSRPRREENEISPMRGIVRAFRRCQKAWGIGDETGHYCRASYIVISEDTLP